LAVNMNMHVTILFLLAVSAVPSPLRAQAAPRAPATTAKPRPVTPAAPKPQPATGVPSKPQPAAVKPSALAQGPDSVLVPVNPNSYRIGLNDEVKITVFDEPDLSTMYRVDADGSISFPLIGRVTAAGTTLSELQQRITTMLSAGYIKNPQVRAEVNQYKSQFVYVIGEVRAPGKIAMTGSTMTLLEALALAGSPTATASNEVIVVHPNRPNAVPAAPGSDIEGARVTVNRKDLELGKAGQDVVLQDGDIINVPSAQHFFITGMVRNPGTFVLDPGISIQQAIALAGGLNERGSTRRVKISRLVKGKLIELSVNLEDKIEPGDTITISGRFF
jgi:polysaccharide export outer membrane protein